MTISSAASSFASVTRFTTPVSPPACSAWRKLRSITPNKPSANRSSGSHYQHSCPMKFNADEIASVIQAEIEKYESAIDVREVGTVLEVGDGIARVYGLSNLMAGEMVEFPRGGNGLSFNLEDDSVVVVILRDYHEIEEGAEVKALGKLLALPVRNAVLGRVLHPSVNALDGKGPVATAELRP